MAIKFPMFNTTAIKNFHIVLCTTLCRIIPHPSCKTKHWIKGKLDSFVGIWKSNGPFTVNVNGVCLRPVWSCEASTGSSQHSTTTWVRCWWLGGGLSSGWLGGGFSGGWLGSGWLGGGWLGSGWLGGGWLSGGFGGGLGSGWLGSGLPSSGWLGGGFGGGLGTWNLVYRKILNILTGKLWSPIHTYI